MMRYNFYLKHFSGVCVCVCVCVVQISYAKIDVSTKRFVGAINDREQCYAQNHK
jgi:hypothetical protein